MFVLTNRGYRGDGAGYCWPSTQSGTGLIGDIMGHRPFNAHASGVDFHRGCDDMISQGATVYAPMSGAVIRMHYTFFWWETASQMARWTLSNSNSSLAVSHSGSALSLTCSRVGAASFPSGIDRYYPTTDRVTPHGSSNWLIQLALTGTISVAGAIGVGIFAPDLAEYIALEYDGATMTRRGVGTTTFTANGATTAVASRTWLRVSYTASSDTYEWLHSADGSSWTSLGTETGRTFTSTAPTFLPTVYWRSGDTNATPYTIGVQRTEWYDLGQNTASRFGNHIFIANGSAKMAMYHFESISTSLGAFVSAGQAIGRAGHTGFDSTSGAVINPHVHIEYFTSNGSTYDGDAALNPLAPGVLPRANVSNNVAVTRTRANDPEGNDSWLLEITTTRADQDFDLNSVSLTGNLATRTLNINMRGGIDINNQDANYYDGIRFSPQSFDQNSATHVLRLYFRTSVVGTTFVSYTVLDTAGNTLASG